MSFALHALATGVRLRVLREPRFNAAIDRGWQGLGAHVQPDGSVAGLSPGFGLRANKQQYLVRSNSSLLWGYGAVLRACAADLDQLVASSAPLAKPLVQRLTWQMLSGLEYLHDE